MLDANRLLAEFSARLAEYEPAGCEKSELERYRVFLKMWDIYVSAQTLVDVDIEAFTQEEARVFEECVWGYVALEDLYYDEEGENDGNELHMLYQLDEFFQSLAAEPVQQQPVEYF